MFLTFNEEKEGISGIGWIALADAHPKLWHCIGPALEWHFHFDEQTEIHSYRADNGLILCGNKEEFVNATINLTPSFFDTEDILCPDCVALLKRTDNITSQQLAARLDSLDVDDEQGRWLHKEEDEIFEILIAKVRECMAVVMD